MSSQPKVSVVVLAYMVEKYLDECLRSLVTQLPDMPEIIVVTDGSPDGSPAIARSYAERYPLHIVHIESENGGANAARNRGMAVARGEYVTFVDGDDYVTRSDAYATLYDIAKHEGADIVDANFAYDYPDGRERPSGRPGASIVAVTEDERLNYGEHIGGESHMKLIGREFASRVEFSYPIGISHGDDTINRFLPLVAAKCVYTPVIYYDYRRHDRSFLAQPVSRGGYAKSLLKQAKFCQTFLESRGRAHGGYRVFLRARQIELAFQSGFWTSWKSSEADVTEKSEIVRFARAFYRENTFGRIDFLANPYFPGRVLYKFKLWLAFSIMARLPGEKAAAAWIRLVSGLFTLG